MKSFRFRTTVKLTFALLAVWLGVVWAGLLPRPAFLPPELDIEPLTFLLGTIAALLFGFWKGPDALSDRVTGSHPVTIADESIEAEIRKYLKSRYEHRIRQKLAGREPVNLRKIPSSTGTSDEGAQNFITLPAEKVPSGMAELFDEARGRLLVVGAPGAGKTTLLLQLALELLKRADAVPAALAAEPPATATKVAGKAPSPVPVLLNLATWRSEFTTFDEWLQRILPLELGASKALAEKIRRSTPLILLLDGLDEVPEANRASCLKAIGEYGADASRRFVISSRIAEYAATEDVRNIYLEVEVQPLTSQQVVDNLTAYVFHQPEAKPLLNALQTDPLLREAIANPFYLNTAQLLFATGRKYSDFGFTATDVVGRQRELVERFVEDALERKVKREYPKEKVRKWLSFFAGRMNAESNTTFELKILQPPWWSKQKWIFKLYNSIIIGLIFEMIVGNQVGIFIGIFAFFLNDFSIGGTEIWKWSFKKFVYDLGRTAEYSLDYLILGIAIIGILEKAFYLDSYYLFALLIISLLPGFINFLIDAGSSFEFLLKSNRPYVKILYSSKNEIIRIAKYYTLLLIIEILLLPTYIAIEMLPVSHWLATFVLLAIFFTSFFRHFFLRFLLFVKSSLPLRLVTFLNEMSLRHLLEFDGDPETGKGGGSWSWRHRIIQEYFLEAPASALRSP